MFKSKDAISKVSSEIPLAKASEHERFCRGVPWNAPTGIHALSKKGREVNSYRRGSRGVRYIFTILCILIGFSALPTYAEDETPPTDTDVWVTTQDRSSFRAGPGMAFQRLAIIQPGVTLPAIGRTRDGEWIQVEYEGQRGWIAYWLLVWTGDIAGLPLDGVNPVPFARRSGMTVILTEDMLVYQHVGFGIGPLIENPLPCTEVELTGRIGYGDVIWLQFWCAGSYYWIGSYYFVDDAVVYLSLPVAFDYLYGQLVGELRESYNLTSGQLNQISNIWITLANGNSASCNFIPSSAPPLELSEEDLAAEPEFEVVVRAAQEAITQTNIAIELFRDVCERQDLDPFISRETVQEGLDAIALASDNLFFVARFFGPLADRDPFTGGVPAAVEEP
jgi:hypothetical protein